MRCGLKRYRVLVWHIHGSYLNYLVQAPHDFYLPVKNDRSEGYRGKGAGGRLTRRFYRTRATWPMSSCLPFRSRPSALFRR